MSGMAVAIAGSGKVSNIYAEYCLKYGTSPPSKVVTDEILASPDCRGWLQGSSVLWHL